jgi:HPt (histidine-containing phosphotransfer) domain-containing protein
MAGPALDPVVLERLRQLTSPGEPDVLAQVLSLFLEEAPRRLDRIRMAHQARDASEMHRAAHSMKGSAGNIGATELFAICREVDDRARVGDLSGAGQMLDDLTREFERVEAEIALLVG